MVLRSKDNRKLFQRKKLEMPYSIVQKPISTSTSFLGDPKRWTPAPAFTGGFAWINKDASNLKSKSHIAKVRAHVRNEYRYWKPDDPSVPSVASTESSHNGTPPSSSMHLSAESPASVASSELSSSSRAMIRDNSSSATSNQSPETVPLKDESTPQQSSSALTSTKQPMVSRRTFFDPVRGSESVLENDCDPRKEYEMINQQPATRPIPSKSADAAKLIRYAQARATHEDSVSTSRSKHESSKLVREVRDYHVMQAVLQTRSLQTPRGGLRDDPFISFPIESRRSVIEAADYWVNFWAPAQTPGYIKSGSWKPTIDKIFSITTGDEGAFQSQVALAQSYLSRNSGKGEEPTKEVLYHQTRAMLSLRKHLEVGSVSAGPLLSSLNLLIMSVVHGDRKAYDFHRKGLERMIQTPPPDSNTGLLHAVINGYFVTSQFYFRLLRFQTRRKQQMLLNKPRIENYKLSYPTHPFYPALSVDIATLPSGFRELALELTLPEQLIEVLKLICDWNTMIAPTPDQEKSTQGVAIWFSWDDTEKSLEVLEQLPRTLIHSDTASNCRQRVIAHPLCMVLMLYSITVHNHFSATKIYEKLVRDTFQAIRLFEPDSRAQRDCRVWMAVIASGCARDAGAGNARIKTHGLLAEVAMSMKDEDASSGRHKSTATRKKAQEGSNPMAWSAAEVVMKRFFWYEHFASNWKKCWEAELEPQ